MSKDPVIFTAHTKPGHMKHTFTGMPDECYNESIWYTVESMLPWRHEMFSRYELLKSEIWPEGLVTLTQFNLSQLRSLVARLTADPKLGRTAAGDLVPESERRELRKRFVNQANDANLSLEDFDKARQNDSIDNHLLDDADPVVQTIDFDYTGEDGTVPQPTPGRIPDKNARATIILYDRLMVRMLTSPSQRFAAILHPVDSAIWQKTIWKMYRLAAKAGSATGVHFPTGYNRMNRDHRFNASGASDPRLNDGSQLQNVMDQPQPGDAAEQVANQIEDPAFQGFGV